MPYSRSRADSTLHFWRNCRCRPRQRSLSLEAAASHIHEGDSIILDSGTTTLALAKVLVGKFRSLFVITNSVPAALELTKAGYELLLVGGQVRNHSMALIGPMGLKNLESFHVDRAFMGTSGITLKHGYSTPDSLDAQIKQAMIRIADKAYVLTDSSKFGHNCMVSFARCSDIHLTLTDYRTSSKGCSRISNNMESIFKSSVQMTNRGRLNFLVTAVSCRLSA